MREFITTALIVGLALSFAARALGQEPESRQKKQPVRFFINNGEVTKLQAIRALIQDQNAKVLQCSEIGLTQDAKVVRK